MTRVMLKAMLAGSALAAAGICPGAEDAGNPLAPWRSGVRVHAVAPGSGRHTIHSYFNICPESPDGSQVLFYASTAPDAGKGDVCIRDRASGEERIVARDIGVEDAHRAACQQWVSKGRRVVYHGERDGGWFVAAADAGGGEERILARGRLAGWSQPHADVVPLYGLHWAPGANRDLEMLNVETGEITKPVTADAVRAAYPEWVNKKFGEKPISVFFPILSPDLRRVIFKMATPGGGDPRSGRASVREGLVCFDLAAGRFLFLNDSWGHPSWHPDGTSIIEKGNVRYDGTGRRSRIPGLPGFHGDHPSASPDGRLITTDTTLEGFGGGAGEWGVIAADARGGDHVFLHRFDNTGGARSWRRSHPHPVFSADGRRIYFNVSSGQWTQLYVAEPGPASGKAGL